MSLGVGGNERKGGERNWLLSVSLGEGGCLCTVTGEWKDRVVTAPLISTSDISSTRDTTFPRPFLAHDHRSRTIVLPFCVHMLYPAAHDKLF